MKHKCPQALGAVRAPVIPVVGAATRLLECRQLPLTMVFDGQVRNLWTTVSGNIGAINNTATDIVPPRLIFQNVGHPKHNTNPTVDQLTVGDYEALERDSQVHVINALWKAMVVRVIPNKLPRQMFEPTQTEPNKSFTGNTIPPVTAKGNGSQLTSRGIVTFSQTPFQRYGIGFRGSSSDYGMTSAKGATPAFQDLNYAATENKHVQGTVMAETENIKLWTKNRDVVGETGVCVCRTLFGATAFPERNTGAGASVDIYLQAVYVGNLKGYDTEAFQIATGADAVWRPGEKVYTRVPRENVIGWIKVKRHGLGPGGNGWTFEVPADPKWTPGQFFRYKSEITKEAQTYLDELLKAWAGRHEIPGEWDFANVPK
jgi:hypothetical protein